ncbi:MAG: hydrogenase nickel incorporation protein HypB [Bacteroidetes bacterium]|nr:hydrogenase nickel incorporation protein HypB [Bacteroidota bacterium]
MCETCGCGKPDELKIDGEIVYSEDVMSTNEINNVANKKRGSEIDHENHRHEHDGHTHSHQHEHSHDEHWHSHEHEGQAHSHPHEHEHEHDHPQKKVIDLNVDILSENNRLAERNRGYFEGRQVLCLNLVSSPGSGKTSILEKTIRELIPSSRIFVIEGDQQTSRDAERIEKSGAPAIQINTGSGCHLDAKMIQLALKKMGVTAGSVLFIENVGNLVCPAMFDLGEQKRVVVISVTEGDDKPLKYPYMFQTSHLCIINKTDLLPYVDFNVETAMNNARHLNPKLEFILMSARTGEGMQEWLDWVKGMQGSMV